MEPSLVLVMCSFTASFHLGKKKGEREIISIVVLSLLVKCVSVAAMTSSLQCT